MKKALSVFLAVLMICSMASVMASAQSGTVKVEFINEGQVVHTVYAVPGTSIEGYAPENPSKEATETTEYIFKGWQCSLNGEIYYENHLLEIPEDQEVGSTITFTAQYSEKDISENQSFWNFIESIFYRINLIFKYFAKVFEW